MTAVTHSYKIFVNISIKIAVFSFTCSEWKPVHTKSKNWLGKCLPVCVCVCVLVCVTLPVILPAGIWCCCPVTCCLYYLLQKEMKLVWWTVWWKLYSLEQPSVTVGKGPHATVPFHRLNLIIKHVASVLRVSSEVITAPGFHDWYLSLRTISSSVLHWSSFHISVCVWWNFLSSFWK